MNLDENVTIAQIAKVREKLSNGEEEIENIEDIVDIVDIPESIDEASE